MSTKSSIFSTSRDHCYEETSEYIEDKEGKDLHPIYLSLSKDTVEIEDDHQWDIVLKFTDPDSHIFKIMKSIKGINIKGINMKDIAEAYIKQMIDEEERDAEELIQDRDNEEGADECFDRIKQYQQVLDLIKKS
jgi:hypothetical protein